MLLFDGFEVFRVLDSQLVHLLTVFESKLLGVFLLRNLKLEHFDFVPQSENYFALFCVLLTLALVLEA